MEAVPKVIVLALVGFGTCAPALCQDTMGVIIPMSDLIRLCESCHGPAGVSHREDVPSLANKPSEQILQALNQFRFRERHCPATIPDDAGGESTSALDMCNISASLSQTEKQELATYFSTAYQMQD